MSERPDLNELRGKLDEIDNSILDLLEERMATCRQIGNYKRENGLDVYIPSREEEKFKALEEIGDYRPFSPIVGFGEDLSACMKLKKLGYKLWCDSNIKVGHVARTVVTEDSYQGFRAYTERNK